MCGIAGVLADGEHQVDIDALHRMTRAAHPARPRTEKDFILTAQSDLAIGGLAIIDVAGGAQPLFAANHQIAGVVNGEIYNFEALRNQLRSLGHHFSTGSDSEVVVHGYAQWGPSVLEHLEGQFAFAVLGQT